MNDKLIEEMRDTIKQYSETLDNSIDNTRRALEIAEHMRKALTWIVENPGAHPNNVRAVALEALEKVKK